MYTQNYLNSKSKVQILQVAFNNSPSQKTAIALTKAKIELEELSYNHLMFTLEYREAKQQASVNSLVECLVDGNFRK